MTELIEYGLNSTRYSSRQNPLWESRNDEVCYESSVRDGKALCRDIRKLTSPSSVQSNMSRIILKEREGSLKSDFLNMFQTREFVTDDFSDSYGGLFAAIKERIGEAAGDEVIRILFDMKLLRVDHISFETSSARNDSIESALGNALSLDRSGNVDGALDIIYDSFEQALQDGRFAEIDRVMRTISVDDYSADLLLGILTATLPAKSKLQSRSVFYTAVESIFTRREVDINEMLAGLE